MVDLLSCTPDMIILSDIIHIVLIKINHLYTLTISSEEKVARAEEQLNYVYLFASICFR